MAELDPTVVRRFWAGNALKQDNRWTPAEMLAWEQQMLRGLLPDRAAAILDLGCGHGVLSRSICRQADSLVGVDQEPGFGRNFVEHTFINADAQGFDTPRRFDLILVFGVITYVDRVHEEHIYDVCQRLLADNGVVVIKNQCAVDQELVVNSYSEALGEQYSGRYPTATSMVEALSRRFTSVERRDYPAEFNPWPNTFHVAFVAKDPAVTHHVRSLRSGQR